MKGQGKLRGAKKTETGKASLSPFDEDVQYFRQNRPKFLAEYRGKYIAILNKTVVDEDENFSSLAKRVFQRYGCRDIFMPKVTEEEEVVDIPTPFPARNSGVSV